MIDFILNVLLGNSLGNVSLMEMLWTSTALVAFYLARLNHREAKSNLAAMDEALDPQQERERLRVEVIAKGHVRRERTRMIVSGAFILFGVIAFLTPAAATLTLAALFITTGLIGTSMLLARDSALDRRDRHFLRSEYRLVEPSHVETIIEKQDREVGDTRREKQVEDADLLAAEIEAKAAGAAERGNT